MGKRDTGRSNADRRAHRSVARYGESTREHFAERDYRLRTQQPKRLKLLVNESQKMLIVVSIHLNQQIILPRGEMTFHHFGHRLNPLYKRLILVRLLEEYAHKGAGVVAQRSRLDLCTRAIQKVGSLQLGYALMDSGTRYATFARNFQKRLTTIIHKHLQNLGVEVVEL